jgi:hypothetical protein
MKKSMAMMSLILVTTLLAAGGFWQSVIDIEREFYLQTTPSSSTSGAPSASQRKNEQNVTTPEAKSENDLSAQVDARLARFNELIALLKEKPYP